jgi:NADH dehydrogenase FAD-containing subunit
VTVIKNTQVTDVAPGNAGTANALTTNATVTLADGKSIKADIYIPATGTTPNTAFVDESLLEPDGRVQTNASTLRVEKAGPRVYAIGDASSYARPAVHNIMSAVPVLCANIKRDLLLDAKVAEISVAVDRIFQEDMREKQMVPIGTRKGVGAAMGYQLPSFLVWLIKGRDYWLWTTEKLWNGNQWAKET